jgi:hypothetical protein
MWNILSSLQPRLLDLYDAVSARLTTSRLECPMPGGARELRLRFRRLHDPGQRAVVERRLRLAFAAVDAARADLAAVARGVAPADVTARIARWFNGTALAFQALDVMCRVHRGLRESVLTIENLPDGAAIAYARTFRRICLTPRYWSEPRSEPRDIGILFHEMTHLFAGTTDRIVGLDDLVYIHEPDGEMAFTHPVPAYHAVEAPESPLYPPAANLVQLADTYECFLEECYLRPLTGDGQGP